MGEIMAKKKKIVIIDQELVPTTLAVKADKKKTSIFSIVWLFIIFSIFIAAVIFLPDISAYINNYLNPEPSTSGGSSNTNNQTKNDDNSAKDEIKEYLLSENPVVETEQFTLSNFKIENNNISFDITNKTTDILDLGKYNYFLNFYDTNKKLVQRIMFQDEAISSSSAINLNYKLADANTVSMTLLEIKPEDYPSHVVSVNENNQGSLICEKDYEKVEYLLSNNKLYAIKDNFIVSKTDVSYNNFYQNYQSLQPTYNNLNGVTSSLREENDSLVFNTTINLNTYQEGSIKSKVIYSKDTDAKIINFELEASGYSCN